MADRELVERQDIQSKSDYYGTVDDINGLAKRPDQLVSAAEFNKIKQWLYALSESIDSLPQLDDSADEETATADGRYWSAPQIISHLSEGIAELSSKKAHIVDDLSDLNNLDSGNGKIAYVNHESQGGSFRWDSADLAAKVAIDTLGIYFRAPAGEDGSDGAWVREWRKMAQAAWADPGSDWAVVMQAAGITARLFPRSTLLIDEGIFQKSVDVQYILSDIDLLGEGVDKTVVQQTVASNKALVTFGTVGGLSGGNASLSGMTLDGNSLCSLRTLEAKGTDNLTLENFKVIGWRYGVECYSDVVDGQLTRTTIRRFEISEPGTIGQVYPLRIFAPWGTVKAYDTVIEDGVIVGSGGYYELGSVSPGTADQLCFQYCQKVRASRVISSGGGEIGVNASRFSHDIVFSEITAFDNDADGINIGSSQVLLSVSDAAGFVAEDKDADPIELGTLTINGEATGVIEKIIGNQLFVTSVSYAGATREIQAGDTVVGTEGGSTILVDAKTSAYDVHLYGCKAYNNGRDSAPVPKGADYAGLKLNLAEGVYVHDSDFRSEFHQKYAMGAVNSSWNYENCQTEGNLSGDVQETGRTRRLLPTSMATPAKSIALENDVVSISDGVIQVQRESWIRMTTESGAEDTVTDITGAYDGQIVVLSCATASAIITVEKNSRIAIGSDIVLRGNNNTLMLLYRDQGAGYWMPVGPESRNYSESSTTEVDVSNSTAETAVMAVTIPAKTLGVVEFYLAGQIVNSSGSSAVVTFRIKVGGVTVLQGSSASLTTGAQSRNVDMRFTLCNAGPSANKLNGAIQIGGNNPATGMATDEINTNYPFAVTSAADEADDMLVEVTVELDAADAGLSYTHDVYVAREA